MSKGIGSWIVWAFCFGAAWALLAPASSAAPLQAGTAKGVITPQDYAGRIGVMGKPLEGVNKDIQARVLVLNDGEKRLVIVTYDLNCLDVGTPLLRKRCRDELGIDAAYLIPLATHNHCAPIQIVPDNFDYGRWLADKIFALIQEAIANEQGPAQVHFGFGHGYFLKAMGNAPIDYEVQVLKVTREEKPIAVLFNHPAHPCQIEYNKIGTGHFGYACDTIEERLPGALALYADACGGNQFTVKGMNAEVGEVQALGHELAEAALSVVNGPMQDVTGPLHSTFEVIPLPFAEPMPYEEAKELAAEFPADIGFVPYPHKDRESNWVRSLIQHYEEKTPFPTKTTDRVCTDDGFLVQQLDTPREFECRYEEAIAARIGPLVFVAMQGEVCAPIGMRIKDQFRYETPIMVFAYMGEHNLYIPTRELVRLNMYQAQTLQIQYASPVRWDPAVEDDMVRAVKRMVRNLMKDE